MAYTNAAKEAAALAITGLGTWISLHTADPGTTGTSEASGGGYTREQTTWTGGSSDGSVPGSQVTFDAAAATYTWIGIWSASSGGTFVGGIQLSSSVVLGATGQVLVTPTVTAA
jgi:hypothetical protein